MPLISSSSVSISSIPLTEQGSTPDTPPAGERRLFAKSDGIYQVNSSGVESSVGGGIDANNVLAIPFGTPPTVPVAGTVLLYADFLTSENAIPLMTSDSTPSGSCYASSYWYEYRIWTAFNQESSGVGWLTSGGGVPCYVVYVFPTPKVITKYILRPWHYDQFPGRAANSWTFKGYSVATDWVVLDTITSHVWANSIDHIQFEFSNTTQYNEYGLFITENGGSDYTGFGRIEMYEADNNVGLFVMRSNGAVTQI